MKCPLLRIDHIKLMHELEYRDTECIEKECAWWDDKYHQCVYITSTEQLLRIADALKAMLAKMPHAEQFTK